MAGLTEEDIIHNCYGYGLFTGGLGIDFGARKLGALAVPMSSGNTQRQMMCMEDFGATAIACTPSYAMYLAEEIEKQAAKHGIVMDVLVEINSGMEENKSGISPEDAAEFCEAAKKHELLLVPSDDFGCPGYFRLCYCVRLVNGLLVEFDIGLAAFFRTRFQNKRAIIRAKFYNNTANTANNFQFHFLKKTTA